MARLSTAALLLLACLGLSTTARAGGYDTPILYSARHQGMGGTAIGYVDDASAVFHNPAGLAGVDRFNLLLDVSLLTGGITSSPGYPDGPGADGYAPTLESEPIIAPLFMVAAGLRLTDWLTAGLAVYPVASASAEYRSTTLGPDSSGQAVQLPTVDKTRLVFFEASPVLTVEPLPGLSVGIGYRMTYASLTRVQGLEQDPQIFNFDLSGLNFAGFRAGAQWRPIPQLSVGLVYRHRIDTELTADEALAVAQVTDAKTTIVLPGKLGLGVRGQFGDLGLAVDLEYGLNSQNELSTIEGLNKNVNEPGTDQPKREAVDSYFMWSDSVTLRLGAEYVFISKIAARLGYVYDGQVSNPGYPSAFGTPPTASHSLTAGGGYDFGNWELNAALAYRFASTEVTPDQIIDDPACATCSEAGHDYSLSLMGFYIDFSIDLGTWEG